MTEFNNPAVLTATTTRDITDAEFTGAQRGHRPDLLREQLILRTPDGSLYTTADGVLVTADYLPATQRAQVTLSGAYILKASDDGRVFICSTAITVTIPAGLSPRPNVAFIPPASGNVSMAVSGGATINGATTTLTRARSANPAGFIVQPYSESDGYGVSGS